MAPRDPLMESFEVLGTGQGSTIVRSAVPRTGGKPYRHTCSISAFESVAHAIEEAGESGFTLGELRQSTSLPFSQIATAMAFLRERGIIDMRRKRNYPTTPSVHLDAFIEYHALREGEKFN